MIVDQSKNRFGRVPQEEHHDTGQDAVQEPGKPDDKLNKKAVEETEKDESLEKRGGGLKKGPVAGEGDKEAVVTKRYTKEANKEKSVESLAGEREHRIPNVTNRVSNGLVKSEIADILSNISMLNEQQTIYNVDLFGPVLNTTLVIAVQVHDRIEYLRQLIVSLSGARGIHKCLIIFSHDVWDDQINKLVRSIDYAMVMQIFYPFSLQTHPYSFPGESSRDCPRNAKKAEVKKLNCINGDWPDLYGHYREAKFTQTKHHWWWKANTIFDKLSATARFNGLVIFLEEDHFVAEDFIHVLNLMEKENKNQANILCMGTYLKKFNYKLNSKQVELTQWVSSKHNMGMALSRSTWKKITQCRNHFCQYDDYNWDWSLLHVSLNCMKEKLQVLMVRGPRVFHIGECGVHHKKKDCASSLVIEKVNYIIKAASQYFFPESLTVIENKPRKKVKLKKGNGGWGDRRDHQLCLNISSHLDA